MHVPFDFTHFLKQSTREKLVLNNTNANNKINQSFTPGGNFITHTNDAMCGLWAYESKLMFHSIAMEPPENFLEINIMTET